MGDHGSLLFEITGVPLAPNEWSRECCLYVQKTLDGEEKLPKNRCRSVLNYWKNVFKKERRLKKKLTEANCKVEKYLWKTEGSIWRKQRKHSRAQRNAEKLAKTSF